ncbi:MAG: carbon starvation protein A, partial [Candidatus Thorarchaeota archaeon]
MTAAVIVAAFLLYFLMYRTYGRGFERKLVAASSERETPAHRMYDGVDYVPANKYVLFGHHFASIAGAAPIVGPAIAMAWGWLPALLWVWLGNVFIGAVHDYLSLMASVRHDGHSIQYISGKLMSKRTGYIFELFVFLALILVIAAFSAVIGNIFVKIPAASSASAFFILAAVITGWLLYRSPLSFQAATVVGLLLLLLSIFLGARLPIKLPYRSWLVLLWL